MKINKLTYTNQYNFKSNDSFCNEYSKVYKNKNGDEFIRCNIYDKGYNIKLTEETKDAAKLKMMIENIQKTQSGYFVRYGKHEYFIPHILKKVPNIKTKIHAVENGNAPLELNEESISARDAIESQIKRIVDIQDLKAIKYLKRTIDGFDGNNLVKTAYSYFDKIENDLYLYIPEKKKMEILVNDLLVKNIKL